MRKILISLLYLFFAVACVSKSSIVVKEMPNTLDFGVKRHKKDSVILFIAKKIEITNKSSGKIRFYEVINGNIKYKDKSYIPVFDEQNTFRYLPPDKEYINPFGKRQYIIFIPVATFSTKDIDSSYWYGYSYKDFPDNIKITEASNRSRLINDSLTSLQNKETVKFLFQTDNRKNNYFITYNFKDSTTIAKDEAELWEEYRKSKDEQK